MQHSAVASLRKPVFDREKMLHQQDTSELRNQFLREESTVLGLPFDRLTLEDAEKKLRAEFIRNRTLPSESPFVLSTPNLNFSISALTGHVFRNSVFESDLSIADGMPIIWAARFVGEPIQERIAGSTLFERLRGKDAGEITVFFFGGMNDVAYRAMESINQSDCGLRAVGALNPGVGSVADMSSDELIEEINAKSPDFLVVSLGAKKGQQWIIENRYNLRVGVVSHLGAVVNFVAGDVCRSPLWIQRLGLEWAWRIKEEPQLWRRYFFDGLCFMKIAVLRLLPLAFAQRGLYELNKNSSFQYEISEQSDSCILSLSGTGASEKLGLLRLDLPNVFGNYHVRLVRVDLQNLRYADGTFWALMLRLKMECIRKKLRFKIENPRKEVVWLARLHMLQHLFDD